MSDTAGSLVDKLATVNQKMFMNQEFLFEIRDMSFDNFVTAYTSDDVGKLLLFNKLHKVIDLNMQRQALILELDKLLVQMVKDITENPELVSKYVQDQHKTHKLKESE